MPLDWGLIYLGTQFASSFFGGMRQQSMYDQQRKDMMMQNQQSMAMFREKMAMEEANMANQFAMSGAGLAAQFGAPGQAVKVKYKEPGAGGGRKGGECPSGEVFVKRDSKGDVIAGPKDLADKYQPIHGEGCAPGR